MVHGDGAVGLDAVEVVFDDDNAVANAGIVLVSTLAGRLGIEQLADECVDLSGRTWCGQRRGQGDDAGVGDGARGGLH